MDVSALLHRIGGAVVRLDKDRGATLPARAERATLSARQTNPTCNAVQERDVSMANGFASVTPDRMLPNLESIFALGSDHRSIQGAGCGGPLGPAERLVQRPWL